MSHALQDKGEKSRMVAVRLMRLRSLFIGISALFTIKKNIYKYCAKSGIWNCFSSFFWGREAPKFFPKNQRSLGCQCIHYKTYVLCWGLSFSVRINQLPSEANHYQGWTISAGAKLSINIPIFRQGDGGSFWASLENLHGIGSFYLCKESTWRTRNKYSYRTVLDFQLLTHFISCSSSRRIARFIAAS